MDYQMDYGGPFEGLSLKLEEGEGCNSCAEARLPVATFKRLREAAKKQDFS